MQKKRLHIITYGCQMNQYDSVKMTEALAADYEPVESPEQADLLILNTCSVREKPQAKVISELHRFRPLKDTNPGMLFGVAGCVAQQMRESLFSHVPHLDMVIGPDHIGDIARLVREAAESDSNARISATRFVPGVYHMDEYPVLEQFGKNGEVSAFFAVQKGCDNFCSYCIVPHTRGREKSRPLAEIVSEIKAYARTGVVEATLCGQNINNYGADLDGPDFADLLGAVANIDGIRRVRYVTSHPAYMTERHIDAIADLSEVCEYLHLPIQAGSNRILEAMNRRYTREQYLHLIDRIRARVPKLSLSGDMIVGFPGETDLDFADTLDIMEKVRFDTQFSFIYSPRPHTPAARLADDVEVEEKHERLLRLQALQKQHTLEANRKLVGHVENVLLTSRSRKSPEELSGRTRGNKIVNMRADDALIGHFVKARIVEARQNSLRGELVDSQHEETTP